MSVNFVPLANRAGIFLTSLLLFCLVLANTSQAQENIAAYPILPANFSSIKVFDRDGRFVARILPETRYWTPIERIPAFLQNALVAVEDSRFYEHGGIDVRGIARALVKDVVKGHLAEGGSTITQQLIKNKYLTAEKTIDRKIREGVMAVEFEKKYSKKQILEMYFNEIYYGNGAWGIGQAARFYFDKNPENLTDAECALLAGVPKNPGRYNPLGDPAKVTARRDVVLKRMVDLKMITASQQQKIRSRSAGVTPAGQAPYYVSQIKNKLVERYGQGILEQGGVEVTAALDLRLQKLAEVALREGVGKISPQLQGALISMDIATGDVLAAVGGLDYARSNYNRAFYARRQPGSSIKPLIYSAALEKGITAASIWDDNPVSYMSVTGENWTPQNYGNEQFGAIPMREALAYSNNVISVKLLDEVGVPYFTDFAGRMGLALKHNDLSMALGTEEVTLHELVQAYSPFADSGIRTEARTIIRIFDRHSNMVTENPPVLTPVISPAVAYITTSMLGDVMQYGTARGLKKFAQERPSAGKTGTTDDYRDAWFVGYTPQVVTGVWVGHDKPKSGGKGFTGGGVAAPIWERFMRQAVASRPVADFIRPDNVVSVTIDPETGYPANEDCPDMKDELFIDLTLPQTGCPLHSGAPVQTIPVPQEPTSADLVGPPWPLETKEGDR